MGSTEGVEVGAGVEVGGRTVEVKVGRVTVAVGGAELGLTMAIPGVAVAVEPEVGVVKGYTGVRVGVGK